MWQTTRSNEMLCAQVWHGTEMIISGLIWNRNQCKIFGLTDERSHGGYTHCLNGFMAFQDSNPSPLKYLSDGIIVLGSWIVWLVFDKGLDDVIHFRTYFGFNASWYFYVDIVAFLPRVIAPWHREKEVLANQMVQDLVIRTVSCGQLPCFVSTPNQVCSQLPT